jgi:hypothetical protein
VSQLFSAVFSDQLTLNSPPANTDNNTFVRNHLVTTLRNLNWHVEEDQFEDNTPYGRKTFTNVIATKDPNAPRRIIMSAHFDSKFFPTAPMDQVCILSLALDRPLTPGIVSRGNGFGSAVRYAVGLGRSIESIIRFTYASNKGRYRR